MLACGPLCWSVFCRSRVAENKICAHAAHPQSIHNLRANGATSLDIGSASCLGSACQPDLKRFRAHRAGNKHLHLIGPIRALQVHLQVLPAARHGDVQGRKVRFRGGNVGRGTAHVIIRLRAAHFEPGSQRDLGQMNVAELLAGHAEVELKVVGARNLFVRARSTFVRARPWLEDARHEGRALRDRAGQTEAELP